MGNKKERFLSRKTTGTRLLSVPVTSVVTGIESQVGYLWKVWVLGREAQLWAERSSQKQPWYKGAMYLSFRKQQYAGTEAHMKILFITIGTHKENKRKHVLT